MGEYVKASEIRPGDYVSSFGHGFQARKVIDITGEHTRTKVGDGEWEDRRVISIKLGTHGRGQTMGMTQEPHDMVWRTYIRPSVIIADNDMIIVNGIPVGTIKLAPDVKAFEYMNKKREIIGGPTGYAWVIYDTEGNFKGQAVDYDFCLENMIHGALMDMERAEKG